MKQSAEICIKILMNNTYYYTSDSLWKNICCRYCIYHVKFNVCLVTKPLGVFSETEWLKQMNVFFCLLFKKCIIKQLLNSVFAWYHELSKPRVCILTIHDIMISCSTSSNNCLILFILVKKKLRKRVAFYSTDNLVTLLKSLFGILNLGVTFFCNVCNL